MVGNFSTASVLPVPMPLPTPMPLPVVGYGSTPIPEALSLHNHSVVSKQGAVPKQGAVLPASAWQDTRVTVKPMQQHEMLKLPIIEESKIIAPLVKDELFDIDLWVVCTGNTCRSAAMAMALGEQQAKGSTFQYRTCGSGVRKPGQGPTHAMWHGRDGKPETTAWTATAIDVAERHRSKGCKPCQVGDRAVFAVVAEENAAGLRQMILEECPERGDEINIVVMGDIEKGCDALRVDPYWQTKAGAEKKGEVFSWRKERRAYDDLVRYARTCAGALKHSLSKYLKK
jgi:protein-tyrosine-phosphatase